MVNEYNISNLDIYFSVYLGQFMEAIK